MLRKWTLWEKCVKDQNNTFLTHFRLSLSLEYSGKIFLKICQIYIPYKCAQGGGIPSDKLEILHVASKDLQTTCVMPGEFLALWNCNPMEQHDLLASMDHDFLGKASYCNMFSISLLHWGEDTKTDKVVKGKGTNVLYNQYQMTWNMRAFNSSVCRENFPWWFRSFSDYNYTLLVY